MIGFVNEPLLEFRRDGVRVQARDALAELDARLPVQVPILIGGGSIPGQTFFSRDPSDQTRVVAHAQGASPSDAARAVEVAQGGQSAWGRVPVEQRAATLSRAADVLRRRRMELVALAVREAGKPWAEADGDLCEAIDFLEYYATAAMPLGGEQPIVQLPGERNTVRYVPRGVVAVIAPWNFPFAILTGMTAAALATGNAVVLKPAEQTPACAHAVVEALHVAGVPPVALSLLPGGDAPAKALVADPRVHVIAFTGSCAAGLAIIEEAARVAPTQRHLKKVIAEMGGKNCIMVDASADLDDVVPAVLASAFGFAGQKCSAADRVLVHADVADALIERLSGAVATLRVGPAEDFAVDVPAVIDRDAHQRLTDLVERAHAAAPPARAISGNVPNGGGLYVPPTVCLGLGPDSAILVEEIFGPLLSVEVVASMQEACDLVEDGRFALTGGIFSRSPRIIADIAARTPVGNLYINREITGAMVGRQPFGGGRLSGTGPKAGTVEYLMPFVEARATTENTMRHGLVV